MNVSGRTVLLTGATGGIGHAIARTLASSGARLILTGRRADVLQALADELGATAVSVDLSDRDAVSGLLAEHGDADILVANAALSASGRLDRLPQPDIDLMLEVNLRAPIALARHMAPRMQERGAGHLVFISSLSGKAASSHSSIYNATKFGLRGFALALRDELHDTGVGVSTVFPGFIRDAGMFADSGAKLPPGVGTRSPDDVAEATLRAIERDRGSVDVAPLPLRVGTALAGLAPEVSAKVQRRFGGDIAEQIAAGHADSR